MAPGKDDYLRETSRREIHDKLADRGQRLLREHDRHGCRGACRSRPAGEKPHAVLRPLPPDRTGIPHAGPCRRRVPHRGPSAVLSLPPRIAAHSRTGALHAQRHHRPLRQHALPHGDRRGRLPHRPAPHALSGVEFAAEPLFPSRAVVRRAAGRDAARVAAGADRGREIHLGDQPGERLHAPAARGVADRTGGRSAGRTGRGGWLRTFRGPGPQGAGSDSRRRRLPAAVPRHALDRPALQGHAAHRGDGYSARTRCERGMVEPNVVRRRETRFGGGAALRTACCLPRGGRIGGPGGRERHAAGRDAFRGPRKRYGRRGARESCRAARGLRCRKAPHAHRMRPDHRRPG